MENKTEIMQHALESYSSLLFTYMWNDFLGVFSYMHWDVQMQVFKTLTANFYNMMK